MKPKKLNILMLLCTLFLGISACAEPDKSFENVSDYVPKQTITLELTATVAPLETPSMFPTEAVKVTEPPTITLVPTVTPLPTPEPLPTITWVPTVTPIATLAPTSSPTPAPTVTLAPTNTPTPTPVPVKEPPAEPSTFSLTYLDVGQGDAALISCDNRYMLIDGGDKSCSDQMYSYLKRNEISYLDIVVASHAHEDHVGGLSGALNFAKAGLVLCPVTEYDTDAFRDFAKYAGKNGPGITVPKKGDTYALGSATVTILGLNAGEGNNSSIILSVTYQDRVFLFTGDAEREAEQAVLADCPELLAAYGLKVGHHGSADATTYPFLREIMPKMAVISCGAGNPYGHPTDNVLSRLRDAEVTVYRTDLHGDITIGFDGSEWTLTTQKSASEEDIFTPGEEFNFAPDTDEDSTTTGIDYIANKNTKKFHYPGCNSVKQMKESNKKFFYDVTRDYMIEQGYDPCGNCDP